MDGVLALSIGLPTEDDAARGEADFPIATGLVRVGQVDRPAVVPASGGSHAAAPAVDVPGDARRPKYLYLVVDGVGLRDGDAGRISDYGSIGSYSLWLTAAGA